MQLQRAADQADRRARAAERSEAVSADDPRASALLHEKIATLEASIAAMKAANKLVRAPACAQASDEAIAARLAELGHPVPAEAIGRARRSPHGWRPGFSTASAAAEIRRVRARVGLLQAEAARACTPATPVQIGRATITEHPNENRLRVAYPGRLPPEQHQMMRRAGIIFASSQRQLNDAARQRARWVCERIANVVE